MIFNLVKYFVYKSTKIPYIWEKLIEFSKSTVYFIKIK